MSALYEYVPAPAKHILNLTKPCNPDDFLVHVFGSPQVPPPEHAHSLTVPTQPVVVKDPSVHPTTKSPRASLPTSSCPLTRRTTSAPNSSSSTRNKYPPTPPKGTFTSTSKQYRAEIRKALPSSGGMNLSTLLGSSAPSLKREPLMTNTQWREKSVKRLATRELRRNARKIKCSGYEEKRLPVDIGFSFTGDSRGSIDGAAQFQTLSVRHQGVISSSSNEYDGYYDRHQKHVAATNARVTEWSKCVTRVSSFECGGQENY